MAKTPSRQIVIDASVARAAGPEDAVHPTAQLCREFLLAARDVCHHSVFTAAIQDEWDKHQSGFARKWRVSMFAKRKIDRLEVDEDGALRKQVERYASKPTITAIVLKDCHLIEAARASDCRIASLDDEVRSCLFDLAPVVKKLQQIMWVNPSAIEERSVEWLQLGAPDEKPRFLGFSSSRK